MFQPRNICLLLTISLFIAISTLSIAVAEDNLFNYHKDNSLSLAQTEDNIFKTKIESTYTVDDVVEEFDNKIDLENRLNSDSNLININNISFKDNTLDKLTMNNESDINYGDIVNKLSAPRLINITKTPDLYGEITLDTTREYFKDLEDLNYKLATRSQTFDFPQLKFEKQVDSPFMKRMKFLYFITAAISTGCEGTQIEDSFVPGKKLTLGAVPTNDYYGYNSVAQNFYNPTRIWKGAKLDAHDKPFYNYGMHPLYGFAVSSYTLAAGGSVKEALLSSLAVNLIFEYVIEGTYVAPSGIDVLTTAGGSIVGVLLTKYVLKKPFKVFVDKMAFIKEKTRTEFNPVIEPGIYGQGMRFGTKVIITP